MMSRNCEVCFKHGHPHMMHFNPNIYIYTCSSALLITLHSLRTLQGKFFI